MPQANPKNMPKQTYFALTILICILIGCTETPIRPEMPVTLPESQSFQGMIEGRPVMLYRLENATGMQLAITNYGGRIVSWLARDKNGRLADIVLGYATLDDYVNSNEVYFGALIGRYGNRIANGRFTLDDVDYQLDINNGEHHLHGGAKGFHNVVWDAEQFDETHLRLSYLSADGEMGFPGNVTVQVDFYLSDENNLRIEYAASTDAATIINLTTHPFFNLGGAGSGTINDHIMMINADSYTPVDETLIPTGTITPVEGSPFDFRTPVSIDSRLDTTNQQLLNGRGFDHNFVLRTSATDTLNLAARITDPESGRILEIKTTEPGLQFYGGNFLDGSDVGRERIPYAFRTAFCLEPQHFPDSPNQPGFPSTVLRPGEQYRSTTIFTLSIE